MRTPPWIKQMLAERQAELERELAALAPKPRKVIQHTADGTCGALTRKCTPCKRRDIYSNGRCKLHGGLSTGPRTEAGKKRVTENLPHQSPCDVDKSHVSAGKE